ncbi:leucine-rich repeat flightless-interacting protein 2-like isoform X2 [Lineus longissimus]|uniref:leucine-rich repeat flightless-interacting protein 2-like isoform X2 n=1 Tax=Lineus longissimus TaxID=88925 RepID=UPI002B4ED165
MSSPTNSNQYASGRRRQSAGSQRTFTAEDQALNQIAREAEQRLAAKRAARSEAREIRMRELERQQKESDEQQKAGGVPIPRAEEKQDRHYEIMTEHRLRSKEFFKVKSKSTASEIRRLRIRTSRDRDGYIPPSTVRQLSTSSFTSSRRSSEDSIENDKGVDLKSLIQELEDKYKKAAMSNAQLDNEKQTLKYQVDHFKDLVDELEEGYTEAMRQYKDKARDLDFQKRSYKDLERDVEFLKEQIKQRDKLIEEHGLVLVGVEDKENENGGIAALVSPETAQLLEEVDGSLDERIKKFLEEKRELNLEIKRLKEELEEATAHNSLAAKFNHPESPKMNGPDMEVLEIQREANKQVNDYKYKLQKAEQDITNLEGNVMRLESQVKRCKVSADNAEKVEDELKQEKRKLTRELREAQVQIEELQTANNHLQKRLEKLKSSRNALLK